MQLWKYLGKHVKVTTIYGSTQLGIADIYHYAEDTASGIAALTVALADGTLIDFDELEVATIEIISSESPIMASAI